MKTCKDCNIPLDKSNRSIRCSDCKKIIRSAINQKNRDKRKARMNSGDIEFVTLAIFKRYEGSAKKRGHSFSLTLKDFKSMYQQQCTYCGESIKTIGIDRKDNTKGYQTDNIQPCCGTCNLMKHKLSEDVFLNHIKKIYKNSPIK